MAVRKPGDVAELETEKGLAYIQMIKKIPDYCFLIRVIDGFFQTRPTKIDDLAARPTSFVTLFPFSLAIHRGLIKAVGNAHIPLGDQQLPTFRSHPASKGHPSSTCWFWDLETDRKWRQEGLTEEQRRLPIEGIWNLKLLEDRIVQGYKPENDPINQYIH